MLTVVWWETFFGREILGLTSRGVANPLEQAPRYPEGAIYEPRSHEAMVRIVGEVCC